MPKMTNAFREAVAVAATGQGSWISLHTADPTTVGNNEVTGGSPAYARKQTTWTAGSSDGTVVGTEVEFDVPAGTFTHISCWTAVTGGTFQWSQSISGTTFPGQGKLRITPMFSVPQGV
ncbi:phage tail fiber protein [Rhodococcus ruber]|uniref:Minor tail protein n=1 Tax=Rhodococcus ruber TaxID=1830 RepID=A0A098BJY8_9NOCA|nr:hypothetical protein [Rhodococcus ruber]MCZ4505949.1 hypothetical protein [Rhodococcus ruber]MCZ4533528.1 hypothetical protein [Rhodococcus ruber]CDZ89074.1 conserved hypothetical protein [Rhodococcus ruber]